MEALCSKTEADYWYKAVEKPGILILAGTARPGQFVDDDAPSRTPAQLAHAAEETRPNKHARTQPTPTTIPYVPAPPNPHPTPRMVGKGKGEDLSVWDGTKFIKARSGTHVCRGYQDGTCQRMNSWNLCAYDGTSARQCELCLMVGHGSSEKAKCPKQGKGKGAGVVVVVLPDVAQGVAEADDHTRGNPSKKRRVRLAPRRQRTSGTFRGRMGSNLLIAPPSIPV